MLIKNEQVESLDLGKFKVQEFTQHLGDTAFGISLVEVVEQLGEHYNKKSKMHYLIVESDKGFFLIEGERYEVNAGDVVVVEPGKRYCLGGHVKAYSISYPPFNPEDEVYKL